MQKKGQTIERCVLTFFEKGEDFQIKTTAAIGQWLFDMIQKITSDSNETFTLKQLQATYPTEAHLTFNELMASPTWFELREKGLLIL
jgi:hypothetical protein